MPLLLDTGVVYALADADDEWHARCRDYVSRLRDSLLVPVTVLPEVAYLIRERLGARAERVFVSALARGELGVQNLVPADVDRCSELLERYPEIGFVDATVVAVAERLKLRRLATTDRRHFAAIHPAHAPAFDLVP
ncbi:MAG TPA: PIN domain-containing protein [Vicinamibacteria bacterium]|nr:PIN domain-containing protein [Vicinamibacteria bacterium]